MNFVACYFTFHPGPDGTPRARENYEPIHADDENDAYLKFRLSHPASKAQLEYIDPVGDEPVVELGEEFDATEISACML